MSTYICKLCGKEFERKGNAVYCDGPHYRPCPVCGKPVEFKKPGDPIKCCSKECANIKRLQGRRAYRNAHPTIKVCEYCGKEFTVRGLSPGKERFCQGPHYTKCVVCGADILIKDISAIPKTCSEECRGKAQHQGIINTMQVRYGITHFSQNPEFLVKSNVTRAEHKDASLAKFRATCLERYGKPHPMQVSEIHQRSVETNLERYGVENPSYSEAIKQKLHDINTSVEVQNKRKQTSLAHYGVEYPAQSEHVQKQMQATCVQKYGYPYSTQNPDVKKKLSTSVIKYHMEHPELSKLQQANAQKTLLERYNVQWACQLPQCRAAAFKIISQKNMAVADKLKSYGLAVQYEKSIESYSYDLCLPAINVCIEIDPTYTHNTVGNHFGHAHDAEYHLKKSQTAKLNGYHCVHIFDWDDVDKIVNLFIPKIPVYARRCTIKGVAASDASEFERMHHLQNDVRGQKVCIGLYYSDTLVQVMTFGKPRYNKNYEWELLRLCSDSRYAVVGGAERLWKYFIKHYSPKSIISYCDISKFSGDVYYRLGMKLDGTTVPNKIWSKGMQMITNNFLLQRGFDQIFGTNYGKGASNESLMLQNGWLPVYDCGQYRFVWPVK